MRTEQDQPLILQSMDNAARALAEVGNHLNEPTLEFQEKVTAYVKAKLSRIWEETVGNEEKEIKRIVTSDLLKKYVHWRFRELFCDLWVEDRVRGRNLGMGPHPTSPEYLRSPTYETDQIRIIIEDGFSNLGFDVSVEDEDGLGVLFKDIDRPFAYGPRRFAIRAALINQYWSESERIFVPTSQTLLVLVEEAKILKFEPQK